MTPQGFLPVVLAGGRASRFGRDKLREPLGAGMLIERPIAALREVFGSPVALAGACHPEVAACADLVIRDAILGCGPMAGIVGALRHPLGHDGVFVLAGDLANITAAEVRTIRDVAAHESAAWAVLARGELVEACVGVYRPEALPVLAERLAKEEYRLHDALPRERVVLVPLEQERLRNVNTAADLPRG